MRAAVIGCGRMGAFTSDGVRRYAPPSWLPLAHAEAIAAHPALELAALVDPSPEALAKATAAYGAAGFTDHAAMLAAVRPLLTGIATRTPGRAALIQDCVAAGVRALHVEKPLCNSVTELARLEWVLEDTFLSLGAIRRHLSLYRQARDLAWSGRYGVLREVRVNMGAGALYWVHPHSVDLILWAYEGRRLTGVQAILQDADIAGTTVANDPLVAHASLWFDDGGAGHIGRGTGLDLIFDCERGAITVENDGRTLSLHAPVDDDPYPVHQPIAHPPPAAGEGALAAIDNLVGCLNGDPAALAANALLKHDILLGQRVLFAMVQSHLERGRIVAPGEIDDRLDVRALSGANYA